MSFSELFGRSPPCTCLLMFAGTWVVVFPVVLGFCAESQTLELGKPGIINCSFPDDFHAVYWYDDVASGSAPVTTYSPKSKNEPRNENEPYRTMKNGSLRISSVNVRHQRRYKVVLERATSQFEEFFISVEVIAYPGNNFPTIDCDNCQENTFYHLVEGTEIVICSFTDARPPVELEWIKRSFDGDYFVRQQINTENLDGTFNSSITIPVSRNGSNLFTLLVCQVSWNNGMWRRESRMFLDFSGAESFSSLFSSVLYMEINRRAEATCTGSNKMPKIWKRISITGKSETIGFSIENSTQVLEKMLNLEVLAGGNLVFSCPQLDHERYLYVCLYGDGRSDQVKIINVTVLVPPSPPYVQITGCENRETPCIFEEDVTNHVTCAVNGAHPTVSLEWVARNRKEISFSNSKRNVTKRGKAYDVSVCANFKVSDDILCDQDVAIECQVGGPLANIMKAEAPVSIIPRSCKSSVKEHTDKSTVMMALVMSLLILISVSQIILCVMVSITWNSTKKLQRRNQVDGASMREEC